MEFETCAVCGRSILRGERAFEYVDAERAERVVCPLCKPRAEELGWLPASYAANLQPPEPRLRAATALRERIARGVRAGVARSRPPEPEVEVDETPQVPPTPLEVFNASSEVRKVAGLRRSLGEPRICVRPGDAGAELVTVAWDLSWYRWSIRGTSVKQVAKGNEISELPVADRDWNAIAAEDGTVTRV